MDTNDLRELMEKAARHLTGRPCVVRLRPPAWVGADGCCFKRADGAAVIDLDPGLGPDRMLDVFAHEAAHIRLDFATMPRRAPDDDPPPGSKSVSALARKLWAKEPMETTADALGKQWAAYARAKPAWYVFDVWEVAQYIRALAYMPKP